MAAGTPSSVGIATVEPSATAPDVTRHLAPTGETFGAGVGEAMRETGRAGLNLAAFFNDAAADSAANAYQEEINKLLHGDPNKTITGPDGQPQADLGYLGLKGRAALDARPALEKAMEEARTRAGRGLPAPYSSVKFDSYTRRFKAIAMNQAGQHADNQGNVWYKQVNANSVKTAEDTIANSPNDPAILLEQREKMRTAYVRQAQLDGLDDPESLNQARKKADSHALLAQAGAISVTDPQRALDIIRNGREILGTDYEKAYNHYRPRAEQEDGRNIGRAVATGGNTGPGGNVSQVRADAEKALGVKLPVSSGDRSHDENERVGGAHNSQHLAHDTANDIPTAGMSDDQKRALAEQFMSDPRVGGIGFYKGHIHVDTRSTGKAVWGDVPPALAGKVAEWQKAPRQAAPPGQAPAGASDEETYAAKEQRILDMHLPVTKENAALAELAKYHRVQQNQKIADHAAFDMTVKDSVAEAMQTGETSNPIPEETFIRRFGDADGRAKYAQYYADLEFGRARQKFEDLSDQDIQASIDNQIPAPGTAGYAERMANVQRLRKYADELQKQRVEDPAGVVQRKDSVRVASKLYNPQDPSSFAPVMEARLAAQKAIGIEPEYQSPITKAEAMKLTAPLARIIPGQERATYTQVANTFQQMFGDNAQQALAYALRARKVAAEEAQQAAAVMRTVAKGALTRDQAGQFDSGRELNASQNAVRTTQPPRAQPRVIGNPEEHQDMTTEPSTLSEKPAPPPRAISFLLRDPSTAETFDIKYGTGMAKRILERYSGAVGGR